ncbi:phosphopantetheine-binding protein [Verrucomicrobiaceae bacterium 227]
MPASIQDTIKEILMDELMLDIEPDEIEEDTPLMGADSLGLDSVDALQLVVALDKHFGLKISDAEAAQGILIDVKTIAKAVEDHQKAVSS